MVLTGDTKGNFLTFDAKDGKVVLKKPMGDPVRFKEHSGASLGRFRLRPAAAPCRDASARVRSGATSVPELASARPWG